MTSTRHKKYTLRQQKFGIAEMQKLQLIRDKTHHI